MPKTIDNDLAATVMTFGFDSAVACATDALDRLHTTAESHDRVMVLEVMGRYAGWIAIYAGVAGGADVILIPEIPFRYDSICAKIAEREQAGRHFSIVVVAEGRARPRAASSSPRRSAGGPRGAPGRHRRAGGRGNRAAHRQGDARDGARATCSAAAGRPTSTARLCTLFGTTAVELIADGQFGRMVTYTGASIDSVPIAEAVGQLRRVPLDGAFVRGARALGISLGD